MLVRRRTILLTAAIAATTIVGSTLAIATVPRSLVYNLRGDFRRVPADDAPLVDWLKRQPGVVAHTVKATRKPNGSPTIVFIQVRNGWGSPPFPKIESKSAALGYRDGRWSDGR